MDLAALRTELKERFEERDQKRLAVPAASVTEWPAIEALIKEACAGEQLTITEIEAFPTEPVEDAIVYRGQATLFPWSPSPELTPPAVQSSLAVTARFTVDAAGVPQLAVEAQPPTQAPNPPWHLSDSLGGLWDTILATVRFETALLFLTSTAGSNNRYPGVLPRGVAFLGTITPAGAFSQTGQLLTTAPARTVAGPVKVKKTGQPRLDLEPAGAGNLGFGEIPFELGARLQSWARTFVDEGDEMRWDFATAEVVALLQPPGEAAALELRMPLLPTGDATGLSLAGDRQPLKGWEAIDWVAGGTGVQAKIPREVPAAGEVVLEDLQMTLDLGAGEEAPSLSLAVLDVALHTGSWPLLPNDILTLDTVGAQLTVSFLEAEPSVAAVLYGSFGFVEAMSLRAWISVPGLGLGVALEDDLPVDLEEVMSRFLERLTGVSFRPPLRMALAHFELGASLRSGEFSAQGDVVTKWEVPLDPTGTLKLATLKFEGIGFMFAYDGSALTVELSARMSIASAKLFVSASTPGGEDAGWTLEAGTPPQTTISVGDLMKELMFGEQSVPGGDYEIPKIEITAVRMLVSLDAENNAHRFEAAGAAGANWKPSVLGTTLQLAVSLWVKGIKPTTARGLVESDAEWLIEGEVGGSLVLYGLSVSVDYYFAEDNSVLTFAVWYGERGIEATVSKQLEKPDDPSSPKQTILTVRLGDLSLGEILEYLVSLAVPGESRRLPSPWDLLYQVNFKNLSLVANLTTKEVEVLYDLDLDLGFAHFTKIGFLYKRVNGAGRVYLRLYGTFLGQSFGGAGKDSDEPLSWDVVNEEAPDVSGKGSAFLDLTYVGLGQHLALSVPDSELTTVGKTIEALKASIKPVEGEGNPLTDPGAATLRYDGNGKWLFGLEATLVESVYLAAVFYDPHLYGALIELKGERTASLDGLRFELVYRRITAEIGEFSVDLTVPEQFRNWEFGAVSVTLGVVHLDVYTNGNFRIDAGFPHEGDFSSSLAVEVFPFIGRGGFYFAYLTGATSIRVPRAGNGVFDPVIEAGVGLSVGLGKDFHKGPLSAGLTLEVFGIFEGVFAPFHPYDESLPQENYYWFQGTAGIVGKLYGSVDFSVLKVGVSVVARAVATIVIEAHEPTQIDLLVAVEAEGQIEVAYITLHFSFDLVIEESITIGSHTAPPWMPPPIPLPRPEMLRGDLLGAPVPVHSQPQLRQQRHQHRPRRPRPNDARRELPAGAAVSSDGFWKPKAVFKAGAKTAKVHLVPVFTVADPATLHPPGAGTENQLQVVLALMGQNTIAPEARKAEATARVNTDHLHLTSEDEPACVPLMIEALLRWAAAAGAEIESGGRISALQLQDLLDELADPGFRGRTFAYANLKQFLAQSLHLEVVGYPTTGKPTKTSASFFPIVPEISTETTVATTTTRWNFATQPQVSDRYSENLNAYFQQLMTDATADAAADPFGRESKAEEAIAPAEEATEQPSLAKVLFGDYFALLTRAALQGAIDLLATYPYVYKDGKSLTTIAAEFGSAELEGAGGKTVRPAVTAVSVAEDNRDVELAQGVGFTVSKLPYQVRAGQSLKNIAAAAPAQAGSALTATAIGEANASVEGLLRVGETLKIPAYGYTRLENDSDAFLAAFFSVRAQGTSGVGLKEEVLSWYEQALAKLNEEVIWAKIAPGQKLKVPSGYQDSTALTVEYPVHPGDSLPQIAAALAKLQTGGQYTAYPAGGSYSVSQQAHPIAAGETFASVTAAFPELALADLLSENAQAKVLAPLATLMLPDYAAKTAGEQTLATLAASFDLDLAGLVKLVGGTKGIFKDDSKLTIRNVPASPLDALVEKLLASEQANEVAVQLSRFLMHGMRMPAPEDSAFLALTPQQVRAGDFDGSLYSLYEMTGQQVGWPDQTKPIKVVLRKSRESWLSFSESSVSAEGDLQLEDTVETLTLEIDQSKFTELPSRELTLGAAAAEAMPLFETHGIHRNLQVNIHWQAAARPQLPLGGDAAQPGEPTIWPFSAELLRVAAEAGGNSTYGLFSMPLSSPPGSEGTPLQSYAWAVRVPLSLQRVAAEPLPGESAEGATLGQRRWLERVYLVGGADHDGADRLLALWEHLRKNATAEAKTQLFLAYPPNATEPNPRGLASDAVDSAQTYLLQTNLSTDTRQPSLLGEGAEDGLSTAVYSAPFAPAGAAPTAFVGLLWRASVINPGGFYLHYANTGGAGLPDSVFDQDGRGIVDLVCILGSQSGGTTSGGPLLPFDNAAVVNDNLDASGVQMYAMQTDAGAPKVKAPSLPPGNVGFTMLRPEPGAADRTGRLYNLIGFQLEAKAPFEGSNEGLPVEPTPAPAPNTGKWLYHQVFDVARRAGDGQRAPQHCPALPPRSEDPYAGVGPTAMATISFAAHDVLGCRARAKDPPEPLPIPFRYADRVIGLSEWPGLVASYTVAPGSGQGAPPTLKLTLLQQAGSFAPGPEIGTVRALRAASAAALRYKQIFFQLNRPGVSVGVSTSLDSASAVSPLPLGRARLLSFVAGSYVFADQVAKLGPVEHEVKARETLEAVTRAYSVTAAGLLEANQDLLATQVLSGNIQVPISIRAPRGATLAELAAAAKLTALQLVQGNEGAIVPAGTSLRTPVQAFAPEVGKTLAEMARRAGCAPGDIGAANAAVAGLIADGLTITLHGVQVVTGGSTFESLAAAFAGLGVTTTAAEVATAAADVAGIFNLQGPSGPTSYKVESWTVPSGEATTLKAAIAAKFAAAATFLTYNEATPATIAEGTQLATGSETAAVETGVTLREFVARRQGLTMRELATANPTATMAPTTVAGPKLSIPALVEPMSLTAVPYAIPSGKSLTSIATLFGKQALQIGEENQDLGGLFVPGQQVQPAGFGAVTTGADDSIASLRLKFPASAQPSLGQLIAAIESSTSLLRPGALLICPPPLVPADATSLEKLRERFGVDLQLLARVNAGVDGLLGATASVTVAGITVTVGEHGTLTSLYARLREAGGEVDFRGLVEAVAGQGLLVPQARFLLPPPAATAEATLPVTPALECAITPLKVEVQIERPAAEVDPTLADMPEIKLAKTLVPPLTKSAEKGEPISYVPFAEALAEAYGQRLRVASGPKSDPSAPPRLYVVRFEAPGAEAKAIEKVKLGTPASYFAVPPLCTELVSRTAAIRIYQSGSDEPLPAAKTTRAYQAVDVESWVEEALAAIDLVLSPAYAAGAFSVTRSGEASSAFDELVAAKKTLAESISNGALGVLEGTGGNKGSAAEALRQRLDASLVDGFATDAVLQLPTTVEASFGSSREDSVPACADAGGHRLAGKMQVESLELFPRSLEELASLYGVHVAAIARLLGATPNLLVAGTRITLAGKTWTIAAEDALLNGVEALGLGSLDALANAIAQQKPLFREGATVTIDAYSTTTGVEETLVDAAEHLDSPVEEVAVASQSIAGLLPLGAKIYLDGVEHEVTDAMTSLQGAAQELSLGVDVLGKKIAQQAVLAGGKTLRAVRWLPSHSLSPGKIDLDVASGTLDLLLGVEQRSQYRRLLLNLDFRLSGLEYGIEGLPAAPGYERSDWLQFVTPLDEGTATAAKIETDVGKLEVPVPLRAYPVPPRLVSQTASASYDRASVVSAPTQAEKLRRAKAWTYEAVFEVEAAAQDVLYFGVGFNLAPPPKPLSIDDAKDPFEALAEFSANYPRIGTDLANLLLPPDKLLPGSQAWKAAKSAVQALATIAAEIAENWGRVKPGSGSAEGAPTPQDPYEFRLQSRTRSGAGGEQVMDSLVLESTLAPAKWGPRAEPPELAYLDERGKPVTLERGAAPWSGQVIYRFPAGVEVPAFRRRTYAVRYPGLDPVQDQNARASVWLTRNEALVDAARTDSRFVYRTPEIHFHDPIAPSILRAELIGIGEGGVGGLDGAVTSLFEDLLGSKPVTAATMEKLAIRYGWRVAAPEGDTATKIEEGDLVLFTPIAFRPQFAYEAGAPAALATAVEAWLTENPRPSGQVAVISFDLTLFSSADAGAERPLVELKRLDYRLSG